ncbi:zinc-ribbon domain-containing protein [Thermophilibacter sp.]
MRCAHCGSEIPDTVRFCTRCGAPVGAPDRADAGASAAPVGEKPVRVRRRKRTAVIVAVAVAVVAVLGAAAWLLLPGLLGPKTVLVLQEDVPDEAFRTYLVRHVDVDGNGAIDQEEADAVTAFGDVSTGASEGNGLSGLGITSLEGISAFPNLTQLVCSGNQLTELDVSGLPNLTALDCSGNQLTGLDLSANDALASVSCDGNASLASLTLPKGDALTTLHATGCGLASVDLSGLPGLTDVLLDAGAQVTGDAATVDDQTRDNLELLAALYNFGVEPEPWQQTISTVEAAPDDPAVDAQLVWISLTVGDAFGLELGETGKSISGDPLGVAASATPGEGYTLSDDGVRAILATYYGTAPDDLSYLDGVSSNLTRDASSGTWTLPVGTAPVGETVWAGNFTSYGPYLAFDLAMLTLPGTDAPTVHYYHVVAQKSDASRLGYRMVSLSAAGDLSASFPDAVAAYDSYVAMPVADLAGD